MSNFQQEKSVVRAGHQTLDTAPVDDLEDALSSFTHADLIWRGYHPFNELSGIDSVANTFWIPLRRAFTSLQRREDVFMAGRNQIDGFKSVWVVSMGHLMGLFDAPWVGIQPTGKMTFLRYCEFNRVEDGKVAETAMFFDIPHVMIQAGVDPFPPQTGAHLVQPGPATHEGLLLNKQPENEGERTLQLINAMITDLGQWKSELSLEDELAQTWSDNMIWWGPAGIGATYTIERYAQQHAGPFRAGFGARSTTQHICRLAEGNFGGFFGWPNFTATPTGGFMGMPATGLPGEFRVIDIYRREGSKLAENWVFIDLLHFWKQQGLDVLERNRLAPRT